MKMTDIVTNFPPQTYSSSFFINRLGDESGSKSTKIHECAKETQTSSNLLDCFITKVFPKFVASAILAILLLLSSLPHFAETRECIGTGRVRVFKSLVEFQNNKISFNPKSTAFKGNDVIIEIQSEILTKNSFVALDSDFIFKLNLENQKINKIEDNSFYTLTCLHDLSLQNNRIEKVSRDNFNGLGHLRGLNLGDNLMTEVPEYAFQAVPNLMVLNLSRNDIAKLYKQSFDGMTHLEVLDLSHNNLYQIIPEVFQYFSSLKNLQLGSNQIQYADADDWNKMKNLTLMNLTDNALERFDSAYDFAFSSTLRELYLGKNFLTTFNANAVRKTLPGLKTLDISENPLSCSDLKAIMATLNQSNITQMGRDADPEEPTVGGISCNKSIKWYERRRSSLIHKPTSPSPKDVPIPEGDTPIIDNSYIKSDIHQLYTIIFWSFGIVFTYILCDIFLKTGCCRWAISRANMYRRSAALNPEPEYFNLNL